MQVDPAGQTGAPAGAANLEPQTIPFLMRTFLRPGVVSFHCQLITLLSWSASFLKRLAVVVAKSHAVEFDFASVAKRAARTSKPLVKHIARRSQDPIVDPPRATIVLLNRSISGKYGSPTHEDVGFAYTPENVLPQSMLSRS